MEDALILVREAISIEPRGNLQYHILGTILEKQKKIEKAKNAYLKSLELSPEFHPSKDKLDALLNGDKFDIWKFSETWIGDGGVTTLSIMMILLISTLLTFCCSDSNQSRIL